MRHDFLEGGAANRYEPRPPLLLQRFRNYPASTSTDLPRRACGRIKRQPRLRARRVPPLDWSISLGSNPVIAIAKSSAGSEISSSCSIKSVLFHAAVSGRGYR